MKQHLPEQERKRLVSLAEQTLWTDEGADHLAYLRSTRCISDEEIKALHYGYVPLRAKEYVEAKLGADVSGRLIMPLYDAYGELVVVTTRDIRPDSEKPHWHESFEKSQYLYGLHVAKPAIIEKKKVIAVEGQFDTAYLRSIGFKFTVAILGTAMSFTQAIQLSRYCSEFYLFFDGDKGGREATRRSMQMYEEKCLSQWGIHFYPVQTPDDKDPDDFDPWEVRDLCMAAKEKRKQFTRV